MPEGTARSPDVTDSKLKISRLMDSAIPAASSNAVSSRISGFFKLSFEERLQLLVDQGRLTPADVDVLRTDMPGLPLSVADAMVENVIGTFGLPIGLGLNFVINDRDYVVPMVVEEPSVVAAVSHTARLVRRAGGFKVTSDPSMMIGQVQVVGSPDPDRAREALWANRDRILKFANELHPNLMERGGGARDIEVRILDDAGNHSRYSTMVVLHLLVDTCDAMGANMVNTMAEGVAPMVEELTGGRVYLRILSNLADRRLVRATCQIPVEMLSWKGHEGAAVAEGIAEASRFASLDPYRATTHNKGVMNGIDAVALATGNDWRAIEAGAHAHCTRNGRYEPMAVWNLHEEVLVGRLEIPIQVGTVGGPTKLHPTVGILNKLVGVSGARELAEVMAAVGLAQNLAALKALATEGIQSGHMALHARTVAATAGAVGPQVEAIAQRLLAEGDIKVQRARELMAAD